MALTVNQETSTIVMTEEGDNVNMPIFITGIRVESAAPADADVITVTDQHTDRRLIWRTSISGTAEFSEETDKSFSIYSRDGVRLHVNTGPRATLFIYYK